METRRHDIDWVRVIAIGLLIIYHTAIGFQPWGAMIGFITNKEPMMSIWPAMSMLNVWRIPLLFFVSGMGVFFAMQRRSWKQLLGERAMRILVPFLFGIVAISPIHILFVQLKYGAPLTYIPNAGHLWFLGNIFIYVIVLAPLFYLMKKHEQGRVIQMVKRIFGHPLGLLVIVGGFVLETWIMNPGVFELYAQTWHGFFLGFVAFLLGFLCVLAGQPFWNNLKKGKWVLLAMAAGLFTLRYVEYQLKSPNYLLATESVLWILTVFGLAYSYLNRPSRTLDYLSKSAYPVYILHMIFLYFGSWLIFPLDMSPLHKFVIVTVITFVGCFVMYEFLIRRVRFLRPLFGLK